MSDYIELDKIDLLFLNNTDEQRFPLIVASKYKELKPLEEIIKDEE